MIKLVTVHKIKIWREYLSCRLFDYISNACLQTAKGFEIASAQIVLPGHLDTDVAVKHDLNSRLFQRRGPESGGWYMREDAYLLGARRLIELSKSEGKPWLICYAEYSKPADGAVRKRDHIVCGDRVFLTSDLVNDSAAEATTTLRQARSRRTYAVLSEYKSQPCELLSHGVFCTDVFDGDMLVVCRVSEPPVRDRVD